ncbi:MAG: hypothetical protein RLZZ471_1210 [Actinomycetota bacterium]
MAAMKPRGNSGPMEVERGPMEVELELRGQIILKIPAEGGGRIQISVNEEEARGLHAELESKIIKKKK